jgi:hypothetical protein
MRRAITVLTIGVTCLSLTPAVVSGQAHPQQKTAAKPAPTATTATTASKVSAALPPSEPLFTTREVTVITTWFRDNRGHLPPGLAKRETLPPGLEKQLQRKGKLPPGLEKKIQPMPPALEKQLVVLPTGYRRVVIGDNVIVMNSTTSIVYDIVRSVVQ